MCSRSPRQIACPPGAPAYFTRRLPCSQGKRLAGQERVRARAAVRARSVWSRTTLRIRTASGVTSTHSSSRQNSSDCSSDSLRGGTSFSKLVGGRRADVGELLLLGDVDVHVVGAGVLADDHALVDLGGRLDEQGAALLQVRHRVRRRRARAVGHQRARWAGCAARPPTARTPRRRGARCRCRGCR